MFTRNVSKKKEIRVFLEFPPFEHNKRKKKGAKVRKIKTTYHDVNYFFPSIIDCFLGNKHRKLIRKLKCKIINIKFLMKFSYSIFYQIKSEKEVYYRITNILTY